MQRASTSGELMAAFEKHAAETAMHSETLEKLFELSGEKAAARKCDAMQGLILAAQKAAHYEMTTYGTLRIFADHMGHTAIVRLLTQTLGNEKQTDTALTKIAERFVNEQAATE